MIKDITLGQYFPVNSVIHDMDPRIKIVLVFSFMMGIFTITSYSDFVFYGLLIFSIIKISKVPLSYTLRGLKPILFVIVFTGILNIFGTKGTLLFQYKFISISYEGINLAIKLTIRLILLITGTSLLTFTTTPVSLTDGIERLLRPLKVLKVPVHEFAMMMTIALRFIPTLLEETDKIMKAQSSRGADFENGNIMKRAKSLIPVLIPLFVSAFRRAEELAVAMESRCYRGGEGRTRMKELKLSIKDIWVMMVVLGIQGVFLFII